MSLPESVIYSAHDPGGAEAILPVLSALSAQGRRVHGFATGPAYQLCKAHGLPVVDASALSEEELNHQVDVLGARVYLAGTSAGMSVDKRLFKHIQGRMPSLYVLDFWNNYWQRFSNQAKDFAYLPDVICVMDERAREDMLREGFPEERLVVTGNPHFVHFADAISAREEQRQELLFISQPLSALALLPGFAAHGFDEYQVVNDLSNVVAELPPEYMVKIRLHPKEDGNKFNAVLGPRLEISTETTLEAALSRAGLIIGMFSPVLIQAAVAGKQVLSYQPEGSTNDPLVTNQLGITRRVSSAKELQSLISAYVQGKEVGRAEGAVRLVVPDAVERVLGVVESLLNKR